MLGEWDFFFISDFIVLVIFESKLLSKVKRIGRNDCYGCFFLKFWEIELFFWIIYSKLFIILFILFSYKILFFEFIDKIGSYRLVGVVEYCF